jgi:hypothetical protein
LLTLSHLPFPTPLRLFSQGPARRNAAHAIGVLAERRSERDDTERFLAELAHHRRAAD